MINSISQCDKSTGAHDEVVKSQPIKMSRMQNINYLIKEKGFIKIKVISHIAVPMNKNKSKQVCQTMLLVPPTYTVYKLKQQIKKSFQVKESQAIFLFMKSQKIVDSSLTVKKMQEKSGNTLISQCLELSVYSTQFS